MTFSPILPTTGLNGWIFLQRTEEAQLETYSKGSELTREADYFRENIGKVETAQQLVDDRILMKVALGAFGLQDDLPNKFYIQKVLEEGSATNDAFANRLTDKRYLALTDAMNLTLGSERGVTSPEVIEDLLTSYTQRSFEVAIGEVDNDMRLAMALDRDLGDIAAKSVSNDTKWFSILGSPSLREVFETAFNLPDGFGTLDIDKQLETIKDRAQSQLGIDSVDAFTDPAAIENLRQRFFLMGSINQSATVGSGSVALTLLQSSQLQFG